MATEAKQLETPVLFMIFNRPETTRRVFDEIRKAKPTKLFIAADGTRMNSPDDIENCRKTREIVAGVDWPCEIKKLFREKNLGCKIGVSSAIDWFFEQVSEGIILEDDCLPDQSFFPFCAELLERYRNNERVMMISGDNFQRGIIRGQASYYFSIYNCIWGWATWKRAWSLYDVSMKSFPDFKRNGAIKTILKNRQDQKHWLDMLDAAYDGKIDTWDRQWTYSIWDHDGMCIVPNANLVTNIGYGDDATHTKTYDKDRADLATEPMGALKHPSNVAIDGEADEYFGIQSRTTLFMKVVCKLKMLAKRKNT